MTLILNFLEGRITLHSYARIFSAFLAVFVKNAGILRNLFGLVTTISTFAVLDVRVCVMTQHKIDDFLAGSMLEGLVKWRQQGIFVDVVDVGATNQQ